MDKKKTHIKICGITAEREIEVLNELKVDYAGFVLFFPKSKRNNDIKKTTELIKKLSYSNAVAVTVSPTLKQAMEIERAGFDILQVHGELSEEIKEKCNIKIWRAFNLTLDECDVEEKKKQLKKIACDERISGILIDGAMAGSGEVFDWSAFKQLDTGDKTFVMAGGLKPENVISAIEALSPDVVDVSSGVEYPDKNRKGKDLDRIYEFVKKVNSISMQN